jgi:hypothetical protein
MNQKAQEEATNIGWDQSSQNNKDQSKPPQEATRGAPNINQAAKNDSSESRKDGASSETSSQQDQSSSDSSSKTSSDDSSSSSSSKSESDCEPATLVGIPRETIWLLTSGVTQEIFVMNTNINAQKL